MGFVRGFIRKQILIPVRNSTLRNYPNEVEMLTPWGIQSRVAGQRISECRWIPPSEGVLKINSDASLQLPVASIGAVYRDQEEVKLTSWKKLGNVSIFYAECEAVITCVEVALTRNWSYLWVETDSAAAVHSLRQRKAPWQLQDRWEQCLNKVQYLLISHSWREANFVADTAAKHAMKENDAELRFFEGRPPWMRRIENPDVIYYRFS